MIRTFAAFATLLGSLLAGTAAIAAPAVEIVTAEFGLFEEGKENEILFQPASIVPRAVGQRYGWIIQMNTLKRSVSVREEYVLPASSRTPPPETQVAKNLHIPDLRRSQVSQRQLAVVEGQIIGEWSIGPDEPAGKRRLQVVVEGELAASFDFEVR